MRPEISKILNKKEIAVISKLNTPIKIQDFLDKIPFNFENDGDTYFSPRKFLGENKGHCFEGALFALTALRYHGIESYLLDLKARKPDSDHVVTLFRINKYWGAISKTNHGVLRFRDPIYKNIRELALSYFHEYFLNDGVKTLVSFSKPFDLFKGFGKKDKLTWLAEENDLDTIAEQLDKSVHIQFIPKINRKFIKRAGKTEIEAGKIEQYINNKTK